jgi:uncharacterized membrane protein (UPF0127 family)
MPEKINSIVAIICLMALGLVTVSLFMRMPLDQKMLFNDSKIEVVRTQKDREKGLSGREHFDGVMLFVFETSAIQCMWARDMKFPVKVDFLDDFGDVVWRDFLGPGSVRPHCSPVPVRYATEVEVR